MVVTAIQYAYYAYVAYSIYSAATAKPAKGPAQPGLADLRIVGTEYGQAIPHLFGSAMIAGQMWWNTDRIPLFHSYNQNHVQVEFTDYSMSCLIGLTDNEIKGVSRVWMNGALVFTADSRSSELSNNLVSDKWRRLTVYNGAADQMPDPAYEAAVGVGNAPAYRGRSYVFIEGIELGQSGQVPNFTFEVVANGTITGTGYVELDAAKGTRHAEFIWSADPFRGQPPVETLRGNNSMWMNYQAEGGVWGSAAPTIYKTSGKYYCEYGLQVGSSRIGIGICNALFDPMVTDLLGRDANGYSFWPLWGSGYYWGSYKIHQNVSEQFFTEGWPSRASLLLDLDNRTLSIWCDGVDKGIAFTDIDASLGWGFSEMVAGGPGQAGLTMIPQPQDWLYTSPSGYLPMMVSAPIITGDPPSVQQVVSALCERAGLASNEYDASLLSTTRKVKSLPVSQVGPTRDLIELLMTAFNFETVVSDKLYFRPRGGGSVASIPFIDLGAGKDGQTTEPLELKQANDLELPARLALTYINIDADYETDTQYSDRLISATSDTVATVQMALGMTAAQAKAVADTMLLDQTAGTIGTTIAVLGTYCALEPADVVTVYDEDGAAYRLRLLKKSDSYPLLTFDAVVDDVSALASPGVTSETYISSLEVPAPGATLMELLDIPILSDADNNAGFYVAAKGTTTNWAGAAIYQSPDNVEYARVATIGAPGTIFGVCTTILGAWDGNRVFDEMNTVTVNVGDRTLASSTRAAILYDDGLNAMMVGAEFIQYRTATLISAGIYKLQGLLRGGRGTEWAMSGHVASERCVALGRRQRVALTNSQIGASIFYKGATVNAALSTADPVQFVDYAVGLKPFSPVLVKAARGVANSIILEWQRRTRLAVRMIGAGGISVPLGEGVEKYAVDIYDAAFTTLLGTVETSTPALTLGGTIPSSSDGFTVATTPASLAMQLFGGTNQREWPFQKSGDHWGAVSQGLGLGAILIAANDGTITKSERDYALNYTLSYKADPFAVRATPASGWSVLTDGSPLSSTISDMDAYYTMARDHRATPGNFLVTSGRAMRLVFSGTGTTFHAISKTETGFTVIDKSTVGGALAAVRYPIQEFFSGSLASLNSPGTFDTHTWGTQLTAVPSAKPLDCITFGNLIYTHTLGPSDDFNSSTVTVDVTNVIDSHVDIANTEQLQTLRHTIDSGGVIAFLDVRPGPYLADRISDTQGVEIDAAANGFRIVDSADGTLSSPVALPALPGGVSILAVAGDYGIGGIFYTLDSQCVLRKHNAAGALLATLATSFSACYPWNFMLSADKIYLQRQDDSGWYAIDKDLTGITAVGRLYPIQIGGGGGLMEGKTNSVPIPFSATPDDADVVLLLSNWRNALGVPGTTVNVPRSTALRISQISETVGKGYPLELVI